MREEDAEESKKGLVGLKTTKGKFRREYLKNDCSPFLFFFEKERNEYLHRKTLICKKKRIHIDTYTRNYTNRLKTFGGSAPCWMVYVTWNSIKATRQPIIIHFGKSISDRTGHRFESVGIFIGLLWLTLQSDRENVQMKIYRFFVEKWFNSLSE